MFSAQEAVPEVPSEPTEVRETLDKIFRPDGAILTSLIAAAPRTDGGLAGAESPAANRLAAQVPTASDTVEAHIVELARTRPATVEFPEPTNPDRPVMVLDERLEERIAAMGARSEKWAQGLETIRKHRFPVLVGSIVQVEEEIPFLERFRYDGWGAAWIFSDDDGRPAAAAVMINLPKLIIRNRVTGGDDTQLARMLEMHLAHELYGHVVPLVASGDMDHPCRFDPDPDAPPTVQMEACVMERERELLADLGYEPRQSYTWDYWNEEIIRPGG